MDEVIHMAEVGGRARPRGRMDGCIAPTGLNCSSFCDPRALPWAILFRSFRALSGRGLGVRTTRSSRRPRLPSVRLSNHGRQGRLSLHWRRMPAQR
jgi:hypothetical protein